MLPLTLAVITRSLTWLVFCGSLVLLPFWKMQGGTGGGFFSMRPRKQVEWWAERLVPPGPADAPFLLRFNFWAALRGGRTRSNHELLIMISFIYIYINDHDISALIISICMTPYRILLILYNITILIKGSGFEPQFPCGLPDGILEEDSLKTLPAHEWHGRFNMWMQVSA